MRLLRSYHSLRVSSRSLVGANTATFLFWESCRLQHFQRLDWLQKKLLGDSFLTKAPAVGCILPVPRDRIDAK